MLNKIAQKNSTARLLSLCLSDSKCKCAPRRGVVVKFARIKKLKRKCKVVNLCLKILQPYKNEAARGCGCGTTHYHLIICFQYAVT